MSKSNEASQMPLFKDGGIETRRTSITVNFKLMLFSWKTTIFAKTNIISAKILKNWKKLQKFSAKIRRLSLPISNVFSREAHRLFAGNLDLYTHIHMKKIHTSHAHTRNAEQYAQTWLLLSDILLCYLLLMPTFFIKN